MTMVATIASRPPVSARGDDVEALRHIARYLSDCPEREIRLVGPETESFRLPEPVVGLLREIVTALARGDAVSVLPVRQRLTTFQAAELLNVPHQHLIRLLDGGEIPSEGAGGHRRVGLADILSFKATRDVERRAGLQELVRLGEELGLYDEERPGAEPRDGR
jgi:excisionase family DNA binding protein